MTSTITKKVIIPENRHVNIDIDFPEGTPTGEVEIEIIAPKKQDAKKRMALWGKGEGLIKLKDNFDDPIEDFDEPDVYEDTPEQMERDAEKRIAAYGKLKGLIEQKDNFDDPIEDFAEYM